MSRPEEATKREERRSVPIQDEDIQEFMEAWFSVHSELDISRTTAYRYVKKAGEDAGLDKEVTPWISGDMQQRDHIRKYQLL